MIKPDAFILLGLRDATLTVKELNNKPSTTYKGDLALECVTVSNEDALVPDARDVYLVIRLSSFETPLDPSREVQCSVTDDGSRRYSFWGGSGEELTLAFGKPDQLHIHEDFETFDSIMGQYAELKYTGAQVQHPAVPKAPEKPEDLRGHVVLINEDSGEVVGELDNQFTIQEDPSMNEPGREKEPVIIEIPEEGEDARTAFVRAIPPGQGDVITKGASLVSYAISGTTNLLLTAITSASSYAIKHSNPHPSTSNTPSSSSTDLAGPNANAKPPPPPPRALVLLTSPRTRKGLATVHAMSGQAVQVSTKTLGMLDGMIKKAVGGKSKGKGKEAPTSMSASTLSPSGYGVSPRSRSSSPGPAPPPYAEKPSLPPRNVSGSRAPSPQPPALPPRTGSDGKLGKKARLMLSADLILSTIDSSAKQILDVGGQQLGAVVGHKYGADAAHSTSLLTGTAKNVGLVYIDMRGIGRKALVKRVGKEYVKTHVVKSRSSKGGDAGGGSGNVNYGAPAGSAGDSKK